MKITKKRMQQIIKEELSILAEKTYTVVPGDTMHGIANAEGVSIGALLGANRQFDKSKLSDWSRGSKPGPGDTTSASSGRNPNWIYPGEKLTIPSAAGSSRSSSRAAQPAPPAPGAGEVPKDDPPPAAEEAPQDPCQKDKDDLLLKVSKELAPLRSVLDSLETRKGDLQSRPRRNRKVLAFLEELEDEEIETVQSVLRKLKSMGVEVKVDAPEEEE